MQQWSTFPKFKGLIPRFCRQENAPQVHKPFLSFACSGFSPGTLVSTTLKDKLIQLLLLLLLFSFKCSLQAIGMGSVSLVMLELLASANDLLLMLLKLKTKIKIFKKAKPLQHNCNHYSLSEGELQQKKYTNPTQNAGC